MMAMPSEPVAIGDILIMRDGLQNIANEVENPSAKRKQARMLVSVLDEVIERREKEVGDGASS